MVLAAVDIVLALNTVLSEIELAWPHRPRISSAEWDEEYVRRVKIFIKIFIRTEEGYCSRFMAHFLAVRNKYAGKKATPSQLCDDFETDCTRIATGIRIDKSFLPLDLEPGHRWWVAYRTSLYRPRLLVMFTCPSADNKDYINPVVDRVYKEMAALPKQPIKQHGKIPTLFHHD